MLVRTQRRVIVLFSLLIIYLIVYTFYYQYNKPKLIPDNNTILKDASLYKDRVDEKSLIIMIPWTQKVTKKSATNIKNFVVEQVIPSGKIWTKPNKPKNCKVINIQYTYAPWVDTEQKRKKANAEKRDQKVSQLTVKLDSKAEEGDYFKLTIKNIELFEDKSKIKEEYIVTPITSFNKFIKM